MKASKDNPVYGVYVVIGSTKYELSSAVSSISFSDREKEMAQRVTIELMNVKAGNAWLSSLLKVRQRVFIYACDGEKTEEVFRGYIWKRPYQSGLEERELKILCYDNLIYLQESEDYAYFSAGKSSKDIMAHFCKKWGISLNYSYESITHAKLPLRGDLSDIFTSDVLDAVKDMTGKKYVIRSERDVMQVLSVGSNSTIYAFKAGQNAISTNSECSMDGMITKVVILGKADDNDRQSIEATVAGKTDEYGTLQKIINRSSNTSLADAKKEANTILKEKGSPKWEFELKAPDIPWIRKGDKVLVNAGDIVNTYMIVKSMERSISNKGKTMVLTMEKA